MKISDGRELKGLRSRRGWGQSSEPDRGGEGALQLSSVCFRPKSAGGGGQGRQITDRGKEWISSQIKIAWSKSRIGHLKFFRVWGEHEAGRGDSGWLGGGE
jgi:hypothetical protein